MSEAVDGGATARLDELAKVTAEYAKYSNERSGLGCTAAGGWFIATFAITLRSETWGRIASLWSPLVILALVAVARRYYQRFGTVVASERAPSNVVRWRKPVVTTLLLSGVIVVDTALYLDLWSGGSALARGALIALLFAAPALPLLVDRVVHGFWNGGLVLASLGIAYFVGVLTHRENGPCILGAPYEGRCGWMLAAPWLAMAFALGAVLVGVGVHQHRSYRRLERRLAVLREAK